MSQVPQNQTAYPLAWPPGWKRANHRQASRFSTVVHGQVGSYRGERSMAEAAAAVLHEIALLPGSSVVISTNVELTQKGVPMSGRRAPLDPGAAVYFTFKTRPIVLACDKWKRVEDNLWAIAKDIEAQRGRARWGVGNIEQAFAGYLRLAAPGESGAPTWYAVLGVSADATFDQARTAYREKAFKAHPDQPGGSAETMQSLNAAWDQARKNFGQ